MILEGKNFLFALSTLLSGTSFADQVQQALTEVSLSPFQRQAIEGDQPLRALELDGRGKAFMLGRQSVWILATEAKHLSRVDLGERAKDSQVLRQLGRGYLGILARDSLLVLALETQRVFSLAWPGRNETRGAELLSCGGNLAMWVGEGEVARIDLQEPKQTVQIEQVEGVARGDLLASNPGCTAIWVARGKELWQVPLGGSGTSKKRSIFRSSQQILGLSSDGHRFLARTSKSVLVFNQLGNLVQTIPVDGPRALVSSSTDGNRHYYLFDDGLLEGFDLESAARVVAQVDFSGRGTPQLVVRGNLLGVNWNGQSQIFTLSWPG